MDSDSIPPSKRLRTAIGELERSLVLLGGGGDLREDCLRLVTRYRTSRRDVHDLDIVLQRVAVLDALWHHAAQPHEVRLSIWLDHAERTEDPRDARDANRCFATEFLHATDAVRDPDAHARVIELVTLVPAIVSPSCPCDHRVAADIRHMAFGFPEDEFFANERSLRMEYPRIGDDEWEAYRHNEFVLLAQRDAVFLTPPFLEDFEARAQRNIASAMRRFLSVPPS